MTRLDFLASLSAFAPIEEDKAAFCRCSWLGDLFPDLSKRIAAPLVCLDKDFVAGEYVFLRLSNLKKEFIQPSLVSLFTYRPYKWYWEKTPEADRLRAPLGVRVDKAERDKKVREDFVDHLEDLVNNVDDAKLKESFPKANRNEIERRKNVLGIFRDTFKDKESRRKLVMDQGTLIIPLEQASDAIKNFVAQQVDEATSRGNALPHPPRHVLFNVDIDAGESTR